MPEPHFLDTNTCMSIRRERPQTVLDRFKVLPLGSTAISIVTYGELVFGDRKRPNPNKAMRVLEELKERIPVVAKATNVADTYGRIRSDQAARGASIGNNHRRIPAHALSLKSTLVTNTEKEFQRFGGLTLENRAKG
jgi:tRNA(fMet)-specific endonuclease VapC